MDVRLSPEQVALRDSAVAGRRPARRPRSGSSTTPSGVRSSTPRSRPRAGASCESRRRRRAAGRPASRWRIVAEELARPRPTPRSSGRRWRPSSGAWPARRPPPRPRPSLLAPTSRRSSRAVDVAVPDGAARGRRAGARHGARARSRPTAGHARQRSRWRDAASRVDLTRPRCRARRPTRSRRFRIRRGLLNDDDLAAGPPSAWR